VAYKNRERGKTAFPVQTCYVGGGKTVGDPPTDPMPKNGHRAHDRRGRVPDRRPIQENRSKERARQGETKVGWKAHPGGGEAANRGQGGICKSVPPGEVGPWVKGGGEDEAQPLQAGLWIEELILQLHREGARRLIASGGPPVDQFSFRNGEGDVDSRGLSLER